MAVRTLVRATALLAACLLPPRAMAQSTTSLLPDANVLPSRAFRFRVLTSFTRYDELLGAGISRPRNIGATLATDSLGVQQVPALGPIEEAIRATAGLPGFRLTAGNVVAAANSRVATAPIVVEYGLTSRITLGVVVPLVETRTTVYSQLNPALGAANVGPNPALLDGSSALANNAAFVQSVRSAASTLQDRLTACQATPSATGCPELLAQQGAAQTLMQASATLAGLLENLYGTDRDAHPGMAFVPLDSSVAQAAVRAQIQSIAAQYRTLLGADAVTGKIAGAAGPGGRQDFQSLLMAAAGLDSLRSTDHSSIGDISFGASLQLLNTFGDTTPAAAGRPRIRLTANGTFRLGTGQPGNRNRLFDLSTGYGQNGVEGGLAADLRVGTRLSASAVGSYTAQLGTVDVARVPGASNAIYPLGVGIPGTYSAGNVVQVSVVPRIRLAGLLAATGHYSLIHDAGDQYTLGAAPSADAVAPTAPYGMPAWTAHQIGLGFVYSTIVGTDRGPGRIPFEFSFDHVETISGSGGPFNKTFRDQIELRVYWLH